MKRLLLQCCICVLLCPTAVLAQWKPERNVEIIVGTAPGAAPDKTARLIQQLWQKQRIYEGPVTVVNKPGGGNVIAWTYLNQQAGNGHYQMIGNLNVLVSRSLGLSPYAHGDYAWIAMLFDEYFALSVRSDSALASGRDLVARLQKDPAYALDCLSKAAASPREAVRAAAQRLRSRLGI